MIIVKAFISVFLFLAVGCNFTASGENMDSSCRNKVQLKGELTDLQYKVVCENGTEPPFQNEYWDNHQEGIYLDVVSKKPLFASVHKFDSGTGWPSFYLPLDASEVEEIEDVSHGMRRVEVRGKTSNSHLGHVFPDGPKPSGMRYCINSASLKFIPKENLESEGLGKYLELFEQSPK